MGLFDSVKGLVGMAAPMIGTAMGGPFGGAIGGMVGGMLSGGGSSRQMQAGRDAASMMAGSYQPMNMQSGIGGVSFDGGQGSISMSPQMKALQDQLTGGAQGLFSAGLGTDPNQIAQQQMAREMALLQPYQQAQGNQMQSRLFNQGLMGSTAGQGQMEGLFAAQQQQQMDAARRALAGGMDYTGTMFSRGLQGLQGVNQMQTPYLEMARLGLGAAPGRALATQAGAQMGYDARIAREGQKSLFGRNLLDTASGMDWGGIGDSLGGLWTGSNTFKGIDASGMNTGLGMEGTGFGSY